ncbi:MAG: hypothetical protein QNJ94_10635 [Alphaproteobacteria bacterium]|nr:hypothetical protein [Alphaproteobacteria bacterium]
MLSPLKILVLVAIIAVVWYGFRRFGSGSGRIKGKDAQKSAAERRAEQIEDMVKCPYCDTFIPAGQGETCGRPECPGSNR